MDDSTSKENREILIQKYRSMDHVAQESLRIMASIGGSFSNTSLKDTVNECGVRYTSSRAIQIKEWNAIIETFIENKFLLNSYKNHFLLHPLLIDTLCREAVQNNQYQKYMDIFKNRRSWGSSYFTSYFYNISDGIKILRHALYTKQFEIFNEICDTISLKYAMEPVQEHYALAVFNNPFDPQLLVGIRSDIKEDIVRRICAFTHMNFCRVPEIMDYIRGENSDLDSDLKEYLVSIDNVFFTKDSDTSVPINNNRFTACIHALSGEFELAAQLFTSVLKSERKRLGKRTWYFEDISGLLHMISLLATNNQAAITSISDTVNKKSHQHNFITEMINLLALRHESPDNITKITQSMKSVLKSFPLNIFTYSLVLHWIDPKNSVDTINLIKPLYNLSLRHGAALLTDQCTHLLTLLKENHSTPALSYQPLYKAIEVKEKWEQVIDALVSIGGENTKENTPDGKRLIWKISRIENLFAPAPFEQKAGKSGSWSSGRELTNLSVFLKNNSYFSSSDRRALEILSNPYSYDYDFRKINNWALSALEGHPLLFWNDPPLQSIEIISVTPTLSITKKDGTIRIFITPIPDSTDFSYPIIKEDGPNRLSVIKFSPEQQRVASLLGAKGLDIPQSAQDILGDKLQALTRVIPVQSEVEQISGTIETITAESKFHALIKHSGNGLLIQIAVKPHSEGRFYTPGEGGTFLFEKIGTTQVRIARDLTREKECLEELFRRCPTLDSFRTDEFTADINGSAECLECLSELRECQEIIDLEWPQGKSITISKKLDWKNTRFKISKDKDWFGIQGALTVDENDTLEFKKLLELLEQNQGRFIPLDDNKYIELSNEFRKQLEELRALSTIHGSTVRLHPLSTLHLSDDIYKSIDAVQEWKKRVALVKNINSYSPEIPPTLQTTLRDYQIDGFVWLSRLAKIGAGACLADDMGLGKTIQALALLLSRAEEGPTLIIAPTSVCNNWISEITRFAPILKPQDFGSSDRQALIKNAQALDVVICSYMLLQQEIELFSSKKWHTIILDEAQFIKNHAAKRSQAVMDLQGDFRIITTGTPVENHLGELWTLFRFLNPGLLGSLNTFNSRFAIPIEQRNDREARIRLRRLITPFILRRTKTQVLDELPGKTEIVIRIEQEKEEVALYDALRRSALEKLSSIDMAKGTDKVRVLAEITRLRRMCCHPSLVLPGSTLKGSKLSLFGERVDELIDNGHRALVFSQFVDHLSVIRNYLDERKIGYAYLDGSTPTAQRKSQVDNFQSGKGSLFLISLKAGGVGLNLTGADYVFHMDPWWNPAVEDQASDRAYRIGQTRPVTVYRFITKNTIEEKIVDLHRQKRELADSLLEGSDTIAAISVEELLELIKD